MEKLPSNDEDEKAICSRFDRICRLALHGEAVDYYRHMDYRRKHERMLSELSEREADQLCYVDEYAAENQWFQVLGYDIEVKDDLLAEAIQMLSERRRDVILLSYFMNMSDAEIARQMNLVYSTVHEHRKRSLELMKKILEEHKDEEK